jgi:hypothetical protein
VTPHVAEKLGKDLAPMDKGNGEEQSDVEINEPKAT